MLRQLTICLPRGGLQSLLQQLWIANSKRYLNGYGEQRTDVAEIDSSDVNATGIDGDNALPCVVRWSDLAAVKALIYPGIDVNNAGDLG
jgi:hypothetical protein